MKTDKLLNQVEKFRNYLEEKKFSKEGAKSYCRSMKTHLLKNPDMIKYNYKEVLKSLEPYSSLSISARKTLLNRIKKYYDYLLDTNQREDHPCRGLVLKGNIDRSVIHSDLFSMAELEALLTWKSRFKVLEQKNRAIISLLIYQGLTAQDLIRLEVQDVDLDKGIINLRGGDLLAGRNLEIKPKQFNILYAYMNESRKKRLKCETDYFGIGLTGQPDKADNIRTLVENMKPFFSDRNLNPMSIRDSVISHWLNDLKLPLEQVQLMAGHRWIISTERYVQQSIEEQKEILKKFHPLG
jgi:integrase/recombinase XerD